MKNFADHDKKEKPRIANTVTHLRSPVGVFDFNDAL